MNKIKIYSALYLLGLLAMIPAYGRNDGGHEHNGYRYDTSTVQIFNGVVTSIDHASAGWHHDNGLHVILKSGNESFKVYLGPQDYTDGKIKIEAGDKVEITGSLIDDDGTRAIVAREIRKGKDTLVLRKNDGTPMWAGSGTGHHGNHGCCSGYY